MHWKRGAQIALAGLSANKLRSFLTTLGIIIGVMSVILMLAISAGTEAAIAEQINALGANLLIISPMRGVPGASRTLVYDDVSALQETLKNVVGTAAETQASPQTVRGGDTTLADIPILGTTEDYATVRQMSVESGRFFDETDLQREAKVVVLGSGIAVDLFGDQPAVGQSVTINNAKFDIVGVLAPKGIVSDVDYDGRIYMPATTAFRRLLGTGTQMTGERIRTIYVEAASQDDLLTLTAQITSLLARLHDVDPSKRDFTVQTQQDIIDTREATTEAFRNLLAWVAAVSLLVGGIGIMNIMLVSVTERTREIGLRAAIGARPVDIRTQFLLEAVVLSLLGGLVGSLIGIVGTRLLAELGSMPAVLVPSSVPLAFGASALVGILFGYVPANKAAQLDPIVALRHE